MNSKQVIVNGLLTNYAQSGQGPLVLLLHGWGDNADTFNELLKSLSTNFAVIALDLPGFGKSDSPKEAWDLNNYAKFIQEFLLKIQTDSLYAVIGHSNGGAIAIRAVGSGVLTPDRLVLLASSGIRDQYKGRNKALRFVTKAGKLLSAPLPKSAKNKLRKKVYSSIGSDMLVAEHLQETFKKIVTDDVQADANHIKIPSLLIYGEDDGAAPVSYGKRFAELLKNSQLKILPAGHFIHHNQSGEVIKLIGEFLA